VALVVSKVVVGHLAEVAELAVVAAAGEVGQPRLRRLGERAREGHRGRQVRARAHEEPQRARRSRPVAQRDDVPRHAEVAGHVVGCDQKPGAAEPIEDPLAVRISDGGEVDL
jgi:hypothetical protein